MAGRRGLVVRREKGKMEAKGARQPGGGTSAEERKKKWKNGGAAAPSKGLAAAAPRMRLRDGF